MLGGGSATKYTKLLLGESSQSLWHDYTLKGSGQARTLPRLSATFRRGKTCKTGSISRAGYERFDITEYWRFDPSGGEYNDAALAGLSTLLVEVMPGRHGPAGVAERVDETDVVVDESPKVWSTAQGNLQRGFCANKDGELADLVTQRVWSTGRAFTRRMEVV